MIDTMFMEKVQTVGCIVEIAVPHKKISKRPGDSFWWGKLNELKGIPKIGECEVTFWNIVACRGYEQINDFGSYGYDPMPINKKYLIQRFQIECITPEYNIFGFGESQHKTDCFWFEGEDEAIIRIKITGRNRPQERKLLKILKTK